MDSDWLRWIDILVVAYFFCTFATAFIGMALTIGKANLEMTMVSGGYFQRLDPKDYHGHLRRTERRHQLIYELFVDKKYVIPRRMLYWGAGLFVTGMILLAPLFRVLTENP
jgi:hypothetical protein